MEPFAFIKSNKNLAPRDELRSQIWYVWLVGFEPTTSRVVNRALYPLSYNHTQAKNTRVVRCLINLDFKLWKKNIVDYFFTNPAGHFGLTPDIFRFNFPLTQLITLIFLAAIAGAATLLSSLLSL